MKLADVREDERSKEIEKRFMRETRLGELEPDTRGRIPDLQLEEARRRDIPPPTTDLFILVSALRDK